MKAVELSGPVFNYIKPQFKFIAFSSFDNRYYHQYHPECLSVMAWVIVCIKIVTVERAQQSPGGIRREGTKERDQRGCVIWKIPELRAVNERREKVSDEWSKADSEEISPASY